VSLIVNANQTSYIVPCNNFPVLEVHNVATIVIYQVIFNPISIIHDDISLWDCLDKGICQNFVSTIGTDFIRFSIPHYNTRKLIQKKCHYHSDMKYRMTLNIIFSIVI